MPTSPTHVSPPREAKIKWRSKRSKRVNHAYTVSVRLQCALRKQTVSSVFVCLVSLADDDDFYIHPTPRVRAEDKRYVEEA